METILQNVDDVCRTIATNVSQLSSSDRFEILAQCENVISFLSSPKDKITADLYWNVRIPRVAYSHLLTTTVTCVQRISLPSRSSYRRRDPG
jgi:hypothetical protein